MSRKESSSKNVVESGIKRRSVLRATAGALVGGIGFGAAASTAAADDVEAVAPPESSDEFDPEDVIVTQISTSCWYEDWTHCSCPSSDDWCTSAFYRRDCCRYDGEIHCTDWYCSDCCM